MSASRAQRVTAKKRAQFLAALAECGNVSQAARMAHVERRTLYRHRDDDSAFRAEWDRSADLGVEALEDEARRRAYEGVAEPLTSAKGLIYGPDGRPLTVQKYSDTLLIFLLKGARPEKYRDNMTVTAHATALNVTLVMERMRSDHSITEQADEFLTRLTDASASSGA